MADREMTLAELAEASETPPRTIRYYIARGLLDGPARAGRSAAYTAKHLKRLAEIRRLQSRGMMLAEITAKLDARGLERAVAAPSAWWQYSLAPDVTVSVRAENSPWRLRHIQAALAELAARLEAAGEGSNDGN